MCSTFVKNVSVMVASSTTDVFIGIVVICCIILFF